jgi:FkbM family methyltransferase
MITKNGGLNATATKTAWGTAAHLYRLSRSELKRLLRVVTVGSVLDALAAYRDFETRPAGFLELSLRGFPHPIRLRHGTSDFQVFRQIFLHRQYAIRVSKRVEYIIDGGANIGLASLYLMRRHRRARVVAIEPDIENYETAEYNLRSFSDRCQLVHAAVWSKDDVLGVSRGTFGDGRHWATETVRIDLRKASLEAVRAITLGNLIRRFNLPRVDFLKLDIEGAELPVFRDGDVTFLRDVTCCAVECHNEDCARAFLAAVRRFGFTLSKRGELSIASK